jgi:hypothetical protein
MVRRRVTATSLLGISAGLVLALHVFRPGLDPWAHRMSEYATGPYSFLMVGAFVALGLGLVAVPEPVPTGRVLLAVAGVGMAVSARFRSDSSPGGVAGDSVHSVASATATMAVIVALCCSARREHGWARRVDQSFAVAAVALGAASPLLHDTRWTGLTQRSLWVVLLLWLVLVTWRRRPEERSDSATSSRRQRRISGAAQASIMNNASHTSSRIRLLVAVAALACFAIAGCTSDQRRSLGEEDLRDSLESLTVAAVDSVAASANGPLSCTAAITGGSAATATCTGTVDGGGVVEATFTGTADVDAETCSAQLLVRIDGETVAERGGVHCFDSV